MTNIDDSNNRGVAGLSGWLRRRIRHLAGFFLVIVIMVCIFYFYRENPAMFKELKAYGYLGVFIVSAVSSATIILPVPGLIITATLGAVLNPLLVGIVSGLGGTLGELTGYLLGYSGRVAIENIRMYHQMEYWMKRWGPITLFVLAAVPNPFFDVAGAVAGALRFPLWKFCIYGGAGRIIKHTLVAFAGAWGIEAILQFIR